MTISNTIVNMLVYKIILVIYLIARENAGADSKRGLCCAYMHNEGAKILIQIYKYLVYFDLMWV